jgi:hypothetical protein
VARLGKTRKLGCPSGPGTKAPSTDATGDEIRGTSPARERSDEADAAAQNWVMKAQASVAAQLVDCPGSFGSHP